MIAELAYWIRSRPGRQRTALQAWLRSLLDAMPGRVLNFNLAVAHVWAEQERARTIAGRPMPLPDSYIAATACHYDLTIATGNGRDFRQPGVRVFNPFREL